MTLQEKKESVIEDFSMYDEWLDKYEYLIDLGRNLEAFPEELKTEDRLIKGCQSRVWLDATVEGDRLYFRADSDAIITKGIISLLIGVYSGRTAREIAEDDFSFVDQLGLRENLSPTRANGLVSMIQTIKNYAANLRTTARPATEGVREDDIVAALRNVYDPEIPVNVYELGLIYDIQAEPDGQVFIKMTLTAPNCPIADDVVAQVREAVADVPGVKDVQVDLVFEPEWTTDRMSEEAKLELGLL